MNALEKFAPRHISFVSNVEDADLVILHANGRRNHMTRRARRSKRYVVAQYCLRSTMYPKSDDWKDLWDGAEFVWSYYDLNHEIKVDGGNWSIKNFYHSPLGADDNVFNMDMRQPHSEYVAMTSGDSQSLKGESVREVIKAAESTGNVIFHLGPNLKIDGPVEFGYGITDDRLAQIYRSCKYVSGLRKIEGFEMPAVEGLLCGARPILFDTRNYRQWYEPWAEFVPEDKNLVNNLKKLFDKETTPITEKERAEAIQRFNWKDIITNFWERI